jgi:hypothetical protein
MRSGRVELADDVGNGRAHARDVVKAILGDHIGKWSRECEQVFRRPAVGASPVRVAAAQSAALAKFAKQFGYGRSVENASPFSKVELEEDVMKTITFILGASALLISLGTAGPACD